MDIWIFSCVFFWVLSLKSNQTLLRELLTQTGSCSHNKEETVQYIKEKIRRNPSPERSINLFHCLNELGDDALMQEIQDYLKSKKIKQIKLSSSQWSSLVYVLLTSEQKMDEFILKKFIGSQIQQMNFFRSCCLWLKNPDQFSKSH